MRKLFLSGLLLSSIIGFAQIPVVGFVTDDKSGLPLQGVYHYIIKDSDKWIGISKTGSNGIFNSKIKEVEIDSSSKYEIEIKCDGYSDYIGEFNPFSLDTVKISLQPDPNYIPNH